MGAFKRPRDRESNEHDRKYSKSKAEETNFSNDGCNSLTLSEAMGNATFYLLAVAFCLNALSILCLSYT